MPREGAEQPVRLYPLGRLHTPARFRLSFPWRTAVRTPRWLVVAEYGASVADVVDVLRRRTSVCCICPTAMQSDISAALQEQNSFDPREIELVPLSDAALGAHSSDDYRAGRHTQKLIGLIHGALRSLVGSSAPPGLTSKNIFDLAVTLEGVVYSDFCAPIALLESHLKSEEYCGVIVCLARTDSNLPLAKVVAAIECRAPKWIASADPPATIEHRVRSWGERKYCADDLGDPKAVDDLIEIEDLLRIEQNEFIEKLSPPGWPNCGLFVAQNTDAIGEAAATVLGSLTKVAPMAAVAFGLPEKQKAAYWDALLAGSDASGRIRSIDISLSGKRFRAAATAIYARISDALKGQSVLRFGGYDFSDNLSQVLRTRVESKVPLWLESLARSRAVVQAFRPRFVLAYPAANMHARQLVAAAREANIPTFDVQGVFISDHPRNVIRWTDTADYIMAMDNRFADCLERHMGWSRANIIVVGSSRIDALAHPRTGPSRSALRLSLNFDHRTKVIGLFAQFNQNAANISALKALDEFARRNMDCAVVLKMHPRMRDYELRELQDVVNESDGRIVLSASLNGMDVIDISDVVVTKFSNVALEAAVMGRPVLLFNFERQSFAPPIDLERWGIGAPVYSKGAADRLLREVIGGGGHLRRLRARQDRYFHRNPQYRDGKSSQRIAEGVLARIR